MQSTWPFLKDIAFPAIRRGRLDTLQVNVGYRCNQTCVHCHVGAGPRRREEMNAQTIDLDLAVLEARLIATLDITGGRPNSIRFSVGSFAPRASWACA
jgi:MoaA/NifB/PqqE/SkfB family radical SAM enzyme